MEKELILHRNSIRENIAISLEGDGLKEYIDYSNFTIFNFNEWSFILKILFKHFNKDDDITPFLVGSEMILLAAYLKDDIIDKTEYRNNKATFSNKYGNGIASLFSDFLLTKGLSIIKTSAVKLGGLKKANQIEDALLKGYQTSVKGQIFSCLSNIEDNSVENNLRLISLKTNALLEPIFQIPAILYNPKLSNLYKDIAKYFGYSFQIYNDLTDFIGAEEVTGKPLLEDIINKQANIIIGFYIDSLKDINESDIIINLWYNNIKITSSTKNAVILDLLKTNSINDTYDLFLEYNNKLLETISKLDDRNTKALLASFIEYFIKKD